MFINNTTSENSLSLEKVAILNASGLNWKVNPEGIQTTSGIIIPDQYAMIRSDNNACLGIQSDHYTPFQNDELLELLFRIGQQTGLELKGGGSFNGGSKVYFQLKSDDLKVNNDTIKGYITGINSFDGSTALSFGNSNITISCMNTFHYAYKHLENKLRHSSQIYTKVDLFCKQIDQLLIEEKQKFEEIQKLGNVKLDPKVKELVIQRLFEISATDKLEDLSTRKKNNILAFETDFLTETSQKGQNLWGMFSAVTRYTTHSMKKGRDNSEGKVFGKTGNIERNIYNMLVELA